MIGVLIFTPVKKVPADAGVKNDLLLPFLLIQDHYLE